jgi:sterol 14-demethylase
MIRKALRDTKIPGTSYVVPKGAYMQTLPIISQIADEFFKNPQQFDPDRWIEYDKQNKVGLDDLVDYGWGALHSSSARSCYLPFGAG